MAPLTSLLLPPLLALLTSTPTLAQTTNNSSTFIYQGKETDFGPPAHRQSSDPRVVFALNVDASTGDVYFHLESPKDNQWVGVGIGPQMKNALFLIAYASENGTGVTISARTASGHSEPSAIEGVVVEKVYGESLTGANTVTGGGVEGDEEGSIVVDAVCRKCADLGDGLAKLDLESTEQPFIFAVGPPLDLESDSVNAGLQEHILYGTFAMDMTASTSTSSASASVPKGPYTMSSTTTLGTAKQDHDPGSRIHGAVMSLVFIIILPLGALLLRVWNVKAHIIFQLTGWILFCMAFAGGIVASGKYNKSRNFASGHQILGILLFVALLSQWVLGWLNHRTVKKMGHGTVMGKIHLYLGPAVILLGWVNGAIGFRFAGQPFIALPYTILIIIMVVLYTLVRILITRRRKQAKAEEAPPGMPAFGAGGAPQYGGTPYGETPLSNQQDGYFRSGGGGDGNTPSDAPPAYNQSQPGIHLQQYPSTQSLPQAGQAPVQPRGMV